MSDITIRNATLADAPRILEIYAYYIEHTVITFEYDVPSLAEFEDRMRAIMQKYPYLVIERDGRIEGYAYAHAFVGRVQFTTLEVGLAGGLLLIGGHGIPVLDVGLPALQQGMLRGDDHIGGAEQGIGTGGIDGDLVADVGLEGDLGSGGTADPVALLDLDTFDVVHVLQIVQQTLGVGGDLQHPLALLLADDLAAAALADAVDDFLVGQHALAAGAPVDGHGGLIGQTVLI